MNILRQALSGAAKIGGAGFAGYGADKERIAVEALQRRAVERQEAQDRLAATIRAQAEARRAAIPGLYQAARAGDLGAQGQLVADEAAKVGDFEPAKPNEPDLQVVDGQIVNKQAATATPIAGYVAPQKEDNGAAVTRQLQRETSLSQRYQSNPTVQNAYGIANAAEQIRAIAGQPANPQNDLDIIYQVVKLRDPGSVVREGEIDLQRAARSVGTQVATAWNKAQKGEILTPEERQQILSMVGVKEDAARQQIAPIQAEFGRQARQYGADSAFVAPSPFRTPAAGKPTGVPTAAAVPSFEEWLKKRGGGGE